MAKTVVGIAFAVLALLAAVTSPGLAQTHQFGDFHWNSDKPGIIVLDGPIGTDAALDFRRALRALPGLKAVSLNSPGGSVIIALLIADEVHERGLNTEIPDDALCYSACSFIFFSGQERRAKGKLGVHQFASGSGDVLSVQSAISDLLDLMNRVEVPAQVLTIMFRTPPSAMYVFSPEEVARLGIDRTASGRPPEKDSSYEVGGGEANGRVSEAVAYPPPSQAAKLSKRAVFYQEKFGNSPGTQESGNVFWSVIETPPFEGKQDEAAIRAVVEVPDENLKLTMTITRNADPSLPASHVIELLFDVPRNFSGGAVSNVQRLALKDTEQARGDPLICVAGKVADNRFIIALNNLDEAIETNLTLLQSKQWIDVPLAYSSGRRALMSFEKGVPGNAVFKRVIESWKSRPPALTVMIP
ncbi:hypothetical protein [Aurantimonas sp. VKM B-3413]|uniref:COG3904 family protein n=1 Tax=Aurantimonas sp. VKM B-3413 TaxID=2779401 RepID=UPI001E625BA0|nr:hypothetical protein [Aurantimonas sp. VKM B-3413]MCB8839144.1 hypothetical protein [Aurantimonas sp. VKM B-3413]